MGDLRTSEFDALLLEDACKLVRAGYSREQAAKVAIDAVMRFWELALIRVHCHDPERLYRECSTLTRINLIASGVPSDCVERYIKIKEREDNGII